MHECFKNRDKPSTAMEVSIILEGFMRSVEMHNLKYVYLIGDGDSSVTKKLIEARPYGSKLVQKIECCNHTYFEIFVLNCVILHKNG